MYCERAGAGGLWAEPLNAVTNLAFVAAAVRMALRLRRTPGLDWRNGWALWLLWHLLNAVLPLLLLEGLRQQAEASASAAQPRPSDAVSAPLQDP